MANPYKLCCCGMKRVSPVVSSSMRTNAPIRYVPGPARGVAATPAPLRARAVQEHGGRGRSRAGDRGARLAIADAVAAWYQPPELALPDHAQSVDRHRPLPLP